MKTKLIITGLTVLALSTFNPQLSTAFAQGSLTPPGAPAPTMKSADQIEPRTIVNAVNTPGNADSLFVISQPGSYYLTANLTGVSGQDGITILTNNVTLDLSGFALLGNAVPNYAVNMSNGCTNITVRNGSISGWGNNSGGGGVNGNNAHNLSCEQLNVSSCGYGIFVSYATVSGCTAQSCNLDGINVHNNCTVSGCTARSCYTGVFASSSTVSGCAVQSCSKYGIYASSSTVSGCYVNGNSYSGIYVNLPGCQIIGNNCIGNNTSGNTVDAGIFLNAANNRVEDNHVSASGYAGIQVYVYSGYTNNIIIKNTVSGNGANNYLTPGNQVVGPLITNTVSGIITNSNPWANFSF